MASSYYSNLSQSFHFSISHNLKIIKFIKFIHVTFEMDKYKDNHIPTYMLDNMKNLLSYVGNPTTPGGVVY